ncbi:MAG: hypothetical protein ACI85K_002724 [Hyphomicrobiaceae bacterium]|jgi:hypothetical protein
MNSSRNTFLPVAIALTAVLSVPVMAQNPVQFQNGQVADASAVNSNFSIVNDKATAAKTAADAAQATADVAQASANTAANQAGAAQTIANSFASLLTVFNNKLGIGTTSPTSNLQIANGLDNNGTDASLRIQSGTTTMLMDGNELDSFDSNPNEPNNLYLNFNSNGNVYMLANGSNSRVGIGTTNPNTTLTVNGSASKPGGGSWTSFSDRRLKKNISRIESPLHTVLGLRGVHFEYKDPAKLNELAGQRTGFIAQEVERVLPDWVSEGDDGMKRVTIRGFEALAVESLRELNQRNLDLQVENDALHQRLASLEAAVAQLQPLLAARK